MTVRERPGVYAEYCVKSSTRIGTEPATVGVAAVALGDAHTAEAVVSYADALSRYGISSMTGLIKTLFNNGAGKIIAAPVTDGDYASAFAALTAAGADIIVCDSNDAEVLADMKSELENAQYCLGVAEFCGNAGQCVSLAQSLNFERLVICGNYTDKTGGIAAALAAAIAYENDPLVSFNGYVLTDCGDLNYDFTEQEIEALIAGGITPVEYDGRSICVVRAVTTKTVINGVSDKSLRELNTVLVANDVLKSVHDALKIRFSGGRNDELTRGAIRSQVVVELEKKLKAGLIESYGNVISAPDGNDPTVCRVSFEFTATYGLNSIVLTAYMEV